MANTIKKGKGDGVPLQERLEKFERKIDSIQSFIKNHKQVSSEEKELLDLSFETLLDFVNKKTDKLI